MISVINLEDFKKPTQLDDEPEPIQHDKIKTMQDEQSKQSSENLKVVLKSLAEASTVHGIPNVVKAPQIAVKVLWSLLFLASFGLLTYQVYHLILTFLAKPIDTKVSLEFSPLRFPAITFCNMNPVKNSKMTKELQDAISDRKTISSLRKKRYIIERPTVFEDSTIWSNADNQLEYVYLGGISQSTTSSEETGPDLQPSENQQIHRTTENLEYTEAMPLHRFERSASSDSYSETEPSSQSSSISESPLDSLSDTISPTPYYSSSYDYWSSSESESDYYESDSASSSYVHSMQQYIDTVFTGERDDWETKRRRFQHVFKSMPVLSRVNIGHRVEDMVIKATFLGINRNSSKFKRLETAEYGNCYTIDDKLYRSWRNGPANGVWLTLNLEGDEYVANLDSAYGVRIVFHEPGTMPLPAQEGILLSPGSETNIALKMVRLSRLGQPYGECTDGEDFFKAFQIKYTAATCLQICRAQLILDICGCLPFDAPELDFDHKFPVCDMSTSKVERCVLFSVDGALSSGELECSCPHLCNEVVYEKTLSWREWPNNDYMENFLFDEMCKQMKTSPYSTYSTCEDVDASEGNTSCNSTKYYKLCEEDYIIDHSEWQKNFLRVVVYFESLDHEKIVERPSYEIYRFGSDIGGTLGLCIGASLLSLAEFLHLWMEVFLWWYRKKTHHNTHPTKSSEEKLKPV